MSNINLGLADSMSLMNKGSEAIKLYLNICKRSCVGKRKKPRSLKRERLDDVNVLDVRAEKVQSDAVRPFDELC